MRGTSRAGWAAVAIARERMGCYPDHPAVDVTFVPPSAVSGGWSVALAGRRRILISNPAVDDALIGHPQRLTVAAHQAQEALRNQRFGHGL